MAKDTVRNIHININGKEVVNSFSGISKAMRQTHRDIANLNANDADYQEQLKKHKQTLALLRNEYERTREEIGRVPAQMNKVKSEIADLGVGMAKAFTVGAVVGKFVQEFELARQISAKFDQAQADLAGVMETTKKGVSGLTEDAKKYGATTSFSATQVSELQLELAKLGKTESEIKGMTKGVLDAAVALDAGLGPAAELVGGQLNSFGEDASQAQRYADVLANSANISAASFESQATALPKVSAVAAQMNMTFERTNAILGVLADQNVAAETSGTGLRNILLTASKEGRNYEDMLRDIAKSTDGTKLATEMFGKENATVAVILANSYDKVEDATKRLENSVGSAAALAETKLDSVTGAQTLFNSAWEGMILSFDDGNGVISKVTTSLYNLGTELIGMITPNNSLSESLKRQQFELNALIGKITSANIKDSERLILINKLKNEYPEYISLIKNEDFSNQNLIKTLQLVNNEYRERIKLQIQGEKLEDITKDRDKASRKGIEARMQLFEKLYNLNEKYNLKLHLTDENVVKVAKAVLKMPNIDSKFTLADNIGTIDKLTASVEYYEKKAAEITKEADKQQAIYNNINESDENKAIKLREQVDSITLYNKKLEESLKLAKTLGGVVGKDFSDMNLESVEKFIKSKQPNGTFPNDLTKEQLKAKEKAAEAFKKGEEEIDKILQESKDRREAINLQGIEKEKQQIEAKYAVLFEKYKNHTDRLDELKAAKDAEIAEAEKKGNTEIDAIIKASQDQIELNKKKGIEREEAIITSKYAKEIDKYKGHTEKLKELEAQRDAEIQALKDANRLTSLEQANNIETENTILKAELEAELEAEKIANFEERALFMLQRQQEIAELELEIERNKVLEKARINGASAEEIAAINANFDLKKEKSQRDFAKAEEKLNNDKVKWTELTEEQKLNSIKGALSSAAEAFNEGSTAWKAAKIAETTITTYQSATSAFNSLANIPIVGTVLGAAAAALAVASGLKNIQRISQTPLQKMPTSHFYGGFTGNENGNLGGDQYGAYTGYVHANEWVSPAVMTQSPRYAPIINWLDNERQMMLNGGSSGNSNPLIDTSVLVTLATAVNHLNEVLSSGIEARTNFGYEEVEKMQNLQKELNQTKQNAIISNGN